ncbi:HU family DNA-binding protein [Burkholderia sp. ABCPW 11]|nr:HU family DNA-binding protein [Burkholderia sp. ABCPW 11]
MIGFGAFSQGQRAARTGCHQTTDAEIPVAAANAVSSLPARRSRMR